MVAQLVDEGRASYDATVAELLPGVRLCRDDIARPGHRGAPAHATAAASTATSSTTPVAATTASRSTSRCWPTPVATSSPAPRRRTATAASSCSAGSSRCSTAGRGTSPCGRGWSSRSGWPTRSRCPRRRSCGGRRSATRARRTRRPLRRLGAPPVRRPGRGHHRRRPATCSPTRGCTSTTRPSAGCGSRAARCPPGSPFSAVGLAWRLAQWSGTEVIGHDGGTIGQSAALRVLPERGIAVCVLTNGDNGGTLDDRLLAGGAARGRGRRDAGAAGPGPRGRTGGARAPRRPLRAQGGRRSR